MCTDPSCPPVLKDQNFARQRLGLGNQRGWVVRQVFRDVEFLKQEGIVDYSLLVGLQTQFPAEIMFGENMGDPVTELTDIHKANENHEKNDTSIKSNGVSGMNGNLHKSKESIEFNKTNGSINVSHGKGLKVQDENSTLVTEVPKNNVTFESDLVLNNIEKDEPVNIARNELAVPITINLEEPTPVHKPNEEDDSPKSVEVKRLDLFERKA